MAPHIEPIPERPGVFNIKYTPTTPGTHTFDLLWANEAIPSSPLSFEVIDANLKPFGIPIVINMTANCRKRHLKVYAIHHEKNTLCPYPRSPLYVYCMSSPVLTFHPIFSHLAARSFNS